MYHIPTHELDTTSCSQWQPQLRTTMSRYFFRFTFESSRKYSTDIALNLVGAQHGFGTCGQLRNKNESNLFHDSTTTPRSSTLTFVGFIRCTSVCTIAWFVAFMCAFSGKLQSPLQ